MLRINLIYYGNHTPKIDARILKIRPQYVIINSPHSLWGEVSGVNVLRDIAEYKTAGIKVFGYITGGYEGSGSNGILSRKWYTMEMNQTLIKNMAVIDLVDGIFIDECNSFPGPDSRVYLKNLTDAAHRYGLLTWGNVGEAQLSNWFFTGGGFDMMHSDEDWSGRSLSQVQHDWGNWISVSGIKPGYNARDAFNLTIKAWQMGLAYCYITDFGYTSIPAWLEDYADLLKHYEGTRQSPDRIY